MKKEIIVEENRIIRYSILENEFVPTYIIEEFFFKDGKIERNYRLSKWDDYSFLAWKNETIEEEKIRKSHCYDFSKSHPLYLPFLHLLDGEKELVIDDDDTKELNQKYMRIFLEEDTIFLEFSNQLKEDDVLNKFHIFIKNILYDGRSKIDMFQKDTKDRLYFFFQEINSLFLEEYHQMTTEEYLLQKEEFSFEESKKYVKKFPSRDPGYIR